MRIINRKKGHDIDQHDSSILWFIFKDSRLLVIKRNQSLSLPYLVNLNSFKCKVISKQYLGLLHEQLCYAVEVESIDLQGSLYSQMGFNA
jgi:hypothetical protein